MSSNTLQQQEEYPFIDKPGGPMDKFNNMGWPKVLISTMLLILVVGITLGLFVSCELEPSPVPAVVSSIKKIDFKQRDHILYLFSVAHKTSSAVNYRAEDLWEADARCGKSAGEGGLLVRAFGKLVDPSTGKTATLCTYLPWVYPVETQEQFCGYLGGTRIDISKDYVLSCEVNK